MTGGVERGRGEPDSRPPPRISPQNPNVCVYFTISALERDSGDR
jgi:hypothetical protein